MNSIDTNLLDALRRIGVTIPEAKPIAVKGISATLAPERSYWHVYYGAFDTFVDYRDAQNQDDVLTVALNSLQPWYLRGLDFAETLRVEKANREAYLEWLKRGVS